MKIAIIAIFMLDFHEILSEFRDNFQTISIKKCMKICRVFTNFCDMFLKFANPTKLVIRLLSLIAAIWRGLQEVHVTREHGRILQGVEVYGYLASHSSLRCSPPAVLLVAHSRSAISI